MGELLPALPRIEVIELGMFSLIILAFVVIDIVALEFIKICELDIEFQERRNKLWP
jgi:hypothetical protein